MTYWPAEVAHRAPMNDFPPAWASAWGDDRYGLWADLVVGGVTQRMRWIEPTVGEGFWMGAPQEERALIQNRTVRKWAEKLESPQRRVRLHQGFWLADTPCTQALWQRVMKFNPSHFKKIKNAQRLPVERVSHDEIQIFLDALDVYLSADVQAALPTEAQWEYACRAGTSTAYWWGNNFDPKMANVEHIDKKDGPADTRTSLVASYPANPWGLYDMNGNVWNWCADEWSHQIKSDWDKSLVGASVSYAVRGGSWFDSFEDARSASRYGWRAFDVSWNLGFRFLLKSPNP